MSKEGIVKDWIREYKQGNIFINYPLIIGVAICIYISIFNDWGWWERMVRNHEYTLLCDEKFVVERDEYVMRGDYLIVDDRAFHFDDCRRAW